MDAACTFNLCQVCSIQYLQNGTTTNTAGLALIKVATKEPLYAIRKYEMVELALHHGWGISRSVAIELTSNEVIVDL